MEQVINDLLGLQATAETISPLQMALRAVVVFIVALLLLRFSGKRTFGSTYSFDVVLKIIIGSVLGRAVVAASPFGATLLACVVMVGLHRLVASATYRSPALGRLIKGKAVVLAENGKLHHENMRAHNVTEHDVQEGVRSAANTDDLEQLAAVRLERDGSITALKKLRQDN
ncbi:DUF421 domain-containing protein [Solirubrum puertoriconensis]|uniref:YetF C-terminal domain-containing protein n=1 Tax=Solirubrum puertoriconensis TaxID=1751427 RepID=A0A9X0HIE4_SOLP1|nr:YetF domain-containing protein [Solirubrum puertoriconensis]KUG06422.1 hypothetical protein ASU33_03435 [Solirubrum puertoriconensis]